MRLIAPLVLASTSACSSNAPRPAPPGLSPEALALSPGAVIGAVIVSPAAVMMAGAGGPGSGDAAELTLVAGAGAGHAIGGGGPKHATVLRLVPAGWVDDRPGHSSLGAPLCAAICGTPEVGCWPVEHHAPKHAAPRLRPAIDCHDGRSVFISSTRMDELRSEAQGNALEGAACTGACGARQRSCSLVGGPQPPIEPVAPNERLVLCAPKPALRSSGVGDTRATVP
jgi:hypothetical protein